MSENEGQYNMPSRGHKTRGRKYKQRYRDDIICPECGRDSVYRNQMGYLVSFKCLNRSCKHQWHKRLPVE